MKKGIYLVANLKSEDLCANLIHSIRTTGCSLPIRLIHFGGARIRSPFIVNQVELLDIDQFSTEAKEFIKSLHAVLPHCPKGFLYRFLAWFGDWDKFIYSDNDIVALCNWEVLFGYLPGYDFIHADKEYTTFGRYNYNKPELVDRVLGEGSLNSIFTAGHFLARRDISFRNDMRRAMEWFGRNPDIPKRHDQAMMHVASVIGKWKLLNLCKPPHNWLSSWAGDYKDALDVVQTLQQKRPPAYISHIHYSGGEPSGTEPIHEFLLAYAGSKRRLHSLLYKGCLKLSGVSYFIIKRRRLINRLKNYFVN